MHFFETDSMIGFSSDASGLICTQMSSRVQTRDAELVQKLSSWIAPPTLLPKTTFETATTTPILSTV
jgi:hypothetical protein